MNRERYELSRKPGYVTRVVDTVEDCVDGYWKHEHKEWFDVRDFLAAGKQ